MPILAYCYISIFGSDLDVEGLKSAIGEPNATVGSARHQGSASEPRSFVPALRAGSVREWNSPKEFFMLKNDVSLWDFTLEEEHIKHCLKKWMFVRKILPQFQTETTEIWLHLIYRASSDERPTGVFFSKGLLDCAHELGVSITTDVAFDG